MECKDVAVIGVPDKKWGESVEAIVVVHDGYEPSDKSAQEIMEFCKKKIPGYKRHKSLDFVKDPEMPRTGTGKILHSILRERHGI